MRTITCPECEGYAEHAELICPLCGDDGVIEISEDDPEETCELCGEYLENDNCCPRCNARAGRTTKEVDREDL